MRSKRAGIGQMTRRRSMETVREGSPGAVGPHKQDYRIEVPCLSYGPCRVLTGDHQPVSRAFRSLSSRTLLFLSLVSTSRALPVRPPSCHVHSPRTRGTPDASIPARIPVCAPAHPLCVPARARLPRPKRLTGECGSIPLRFGRWIRTKRGYRAKRLRCSTKLPERCTSPQAESLNRDPPLALVRPLSGIDRPPARLATVVAYIPHRNLAATSLSFVLRHAHAHTHDKRLVPILHFSRTSWAIPSSARLRAPRPFFNPIRSLASASPPSARA
ncbi:hypothetical protein DFH06DRAFT_1429259 [Mycena polygramma]|nr:hypothetical protein DFH06DRAFT_1429259 [Mycena polygramma]